MHIQKNILARRDKVSQKNWVTQGFKSPTMPTFNQFFFLFLFIFCCNPHKINSSSCSLDFNKFPYHSKGECFDISANSATPLALQSCCSSALLSIFQAMAVRSNLSRSIFLDAAQAQDCLATFQTLHSRIELSKCELQRFMISSSAKNSCPKDVDSVINSLGVDQYNSVLANCRALSNSTYSDRACFDCEELYRQSLKALKGSSDGTNGKGCDEALIVSLASSDVDSPEWVHGTFACLWDQRELSLPIKDHQKDGFLLGSKKLLAIIIVAVILVVLAPILYMLTRKRLQDTIDKEIESLSVVVLKKTLEDEYFINSFTCSDLYLFSQDELVKATNGFDDSNLIGEGNPGKIYFGTMPSGMRATIKRINKGLNLHDFNNHICRRSKVRHPNLVSILGYCDRGDLCLVYEHCANGDLASWLLGKHTASILTWEQRVKISIGIGRGLWFLHDNPLEKMVHGDIKLANILLNERLEAKLSDSILPKYKWNVSNGSQTVGKDVFDFGVVLLQLLTGRKPKCLVEEALRVKGGSEKGMADPHLKGAFVPSQFCHVFATAVVCTTPYELERPNIRDILHKLEQTPALV